MSKRLKYIGGHDAVDLTPWRINAAGVVTSDERVVTVENGQLTPEDAPDEYIAGLLEQPANWVEFKAPAKSAPAADTESAASDEKE